MSKSDDRLDMLLTHLVTPPVLESMATSRRIDVSYECDPVSMTRQEMADECDVNAIMARYEKSGIWPMQAGIREPMYVDFTALPSDLQSSMEYLGNAEFAFMSLPAAIRKEFDNDATRFVEFASDRANLEQLRKWGLAEPEKVPDAPMRVEVVNAPAPDKKDAPATPEA